MEWGGGRDSRLERIQVDWLGLGGWAFTAFWALIVVGSLCSG